MRNKEQIVYDSIKLETPPEDYNLIEIHCFLALKQLTIMFYNKQISKENAGKIKQKILSTYEKQCKEYEFKESMFQEHIQHIKETENARTKLHKILNGQDEYSKPITEETWAETVNTCMEIISKLFKGEFI
ncbi:MAG: hypothetical protein IJV31_02540 [Clostridia bacterium]|nr:hypothetical protein [Clostridia bacterium]